MAPYHRCNPSAAVAIPDADVEIVYRNERYEALYFCHPGFHLRPAKSAAPFCADNKWLMPERLPTCIKTSDGKEMVNPNASHSTAKYHYFDRQFAAVNRRVHVGIDTILGELRALYKVQVVTDQLASPSRRRRSDASPLARLRRLEKLLNDESMGD